MNLRQIEIFHAVYLHGSASAAARALNVSQPSVTKVLRHAEESIGIVLFERSKGRLVPTQDARTLFEEVTEQIGYFLEATRAMRPYADADRLEPAARRALVGYVIDEEMAVAQIERMAGWERKSRSEIAWSDEERAAYKTLIDDWAEIVEEGGPVRDCYDPPDSELAVEAAS